MRKSAVMMPIFALLAGVVGFIIRYMEVNTAFDSVTGFAKRGAPSTTILIALSVLVIVLAAVFAVLAGRRLKAENDFSKAFAPKGFLYLGVSFLLALGWIVADVLYYFDKSAAGAVTVIDIIWVFLAAVTAFSLIYLARGAYKGRSGTELLLFSIVPSIFFCYWLIIIYKDNAANPVLLSYCFQCLAVAAATLSFYFSAGFVFKKSVTGRALFSYLVTIFFCTIVLADPVSFPIKMFFGITLVFQLMNSVVFIRNLKRK